MKCGRCTDPTHCACDWRVIARAPAYEINQFGDVRRLTPAPRTRPGFQLKWSRRKLGRHNYFAPAVNLICTDGKRRNMAVGMLVCEAFHGPRPVGHEAAHKDGDPFNNDFRNLRWATPQENARDRVGHGTAPVGERNPRAKLTEDQVRAIRAATGRQKDIGKAFGVSQRMVCLIKRREAWAHVAEEEWVCPVCGAPADECDA